MQPDGIMAEIERLNWSLATITEITRVLVRAKTEREVFVTACEAATRQDFYDLAWIALPRQDPGRTVLAGASAGKARGFLNGIGMSWADQPQGRGPTGTALRTGRLQICGDADRHPDLQPWVERMRAFGLRSSLSLPIRLPNGSIIAAMTVYSRHPDAFGEQEAALFGQLGDDIGFGIDMLRTRAAYGEARAHAEQQDRRIQMLGKALETSAEGVLIADRAGRIFSVNPALARMSGYEAADLTGRSPSLLMAGHAGDQDFAELWRRAEENGVWQGEIRCRRKQGGQFPGMLSLSAVRDGAGATTHYIATLLDLSALKAAEEAARAEKLFSDSMMESTPGIIYYYDRDGRFQRWNRNFAVVSGYSDAEISAMHPLDFFDAEDRALLTQRIDEVFERGHSWVRAPFRTKDGRLIPYLFTGRRVDIDGREYLVGVGIDMSEGNCVGMLPPRD